MSPRDAVSHGRGPIAYMVRNGVAANLLMCFVLAAGLVSLTALVQEAFPVMTFNHVEVVVRYPGATPSEVEESIVRKLEEQLETLDVVESVTAVAVSGVASVMAELKPGVEPGRGQNDIESAVGRIQTLPGRADRPEIRRMTNRQSVIRLILHGDVSERTLKELAFRTEDSIAALPGVSYVETSGVRDYEVSIEVPLHRLRALGLTLEDVSNAVRSGSLDLSAGSIETAHEEVHVRIAGRSYEQQDFERLVVLGTNDGTVVRLGDIAAVRDGFRDADLVVRYQGQPAAFVEVYRSAGEQVLELVDAVLEHVDLEVVPSLPAGVGIEVWDNDATIYEDRLGLLLKNGFLGLILVLVALALFLEIRLAAWVSVGIAFSFAGTLATALVFDVSLNVYSLLAFIVAVGIVVDDAIVVSEHIHMERQRGAPGVLAAIRGARRIAKPVVFAVLTTVAAFSPFLFVPGPVGELVEKIPIIVISVLVFSLLESLLILPSHLSHLPAPGWRPTSVPIRVVHRIHGAVDRTLQRFVAGPLDRAVRVAADQPVVVIAGGVGLIILCGALVSSGIVRLLLVQPVESDLVTATLEMPEGTPTRLTAEGAAELEMTGRRVIERLSRDRPMDAPPLLEGVYRAVGMSARRELGGSFVQEASLAPPSHVAVVQFRLLGAQRREVSALTFLQAWRDEAGVPPGARSVSFASELFDLGSPVHLELSHPDVDVLRPLGDALTARLETLDGVFDVRSDAAVGLNEIQVELRPEARTLGLTLDALAEQVRAAFYGHEALRVQRGREEVRVYVRLPVGDRDAVADLERYPVRTPAGHEVPLSRVASLGIERSPSSIRRKNGARIVTVTADVDQEVVTVAEVSEVLTSTILPGLAEAYPGLTYGFGGQQQEQNEFMEASGRGFVLALLAIYALLAIPLRSYAQPLIVMAVIPFGMIGAVLGHLIMGIGLDFTSILGMIGLSGVVVNDSLVMIDFFNQRRQEGRPARAAIIDAAKGRFRPIFITSMTTFLGFAPLMLEQSPQAQFLIPLGVSMGFGVLAATAILVLMVPALVMLCLRSDREAVIEGAR